jgi:carotenoid cleavage dioxygenase-like enzyme
MSGIDAPGLHTLSEERHDVTLPVTGTVPEWLSGTYILNGPGQFEIGGEEVNHWFDGLAMLRRFTIDDGEVTYTNRFLRSEEFEHARETGDLKRLQFGTTAPKSLVERVRTTVSPSLTDNASVSITRYGDQLAAVTETPRLTTIDPQTLEATGQVSFQDETDTAVQWTLAHAHHDADRETVVDLGFHIGPTHRYVLLEREVGSTRRREIGSVSTDRLSYVHSFGLTDRYAVIVESPLKLRVRRLFQDRPFIERFAWDESLDTRFLIVDRQSGRLVADPETTPFMTYHHVNAFEQGDTLVVDLIAYDNDYAVRGLSLDRTRSETDEFPVGRLRRYEIALGATGASVDSETLHPGPVSMPTMDYTRRNMKPYQYAYCAGHEPPASPELMQRIVKIDVREGDATDWDAGGDYLSEPLFVPRPSGTAEDDGVVLSTAIDVDGTMSWLVVLDAGRLEELARARVPHCLPFPTHGQFYESLTAPTPVRSMS